MVLDCYRANKRQRNSFNNYFQRRNMFL